MRCSPKWQDLSSRREMQRGIDLRLNQVEVAKPLKALSPQLLPPHDREQIKQEKIQANRQAQAWQQSIDSESRPAYAAALWRDSQKLALKLFPRTGERSPAKLPIHSKQGCGFRQTVGQ